MADDWSKEWKASSDPQKQRKYRRNAPYHIRKKFLSAHLADHVAEIFGTTSLPVREGDRAEVMRGDWAGMEGTIDRIDYSDYSVYISGIERERVDTSDAKIALDPSNLKLTKLNVDDDQRTEKFNISEQEKAEIEATGEEEAGDTDEQDTEDGVDETDEETDDDTEEQTDTDEETEGEN
ncbi:MAG: 50S ribosomal protein L24 [Candidatus Nanohaloarchaeota archaeon QJJ-5]|nr:50S ribosomal protein L24 [Candidatus Nanohaloarchaeota archaeon QJJ-5]